MIRVDPVTSFPVGGFSAHLTEVAEVQLEVLHASESKSELVGDESPRPKPNSNPKIVMLKGIGFRAPLDGAESVMTGAAIRCSLHKFAPRARRYPTVPERINRTVESQEVGSRAYEP